MKPGGHSPRPTSGTSDGAPNTQTPSAEEHGPEGVYFSKMEPFGTRTPSSIRRHDKRKDTPHVYVPDVLPDGTDLKPYKRLAEAVIHLAVVDAQKQGSVSIGAQRFLCSESEVLWFWCQWLNVHPDWLREMARRKGWGG